MLVAGRWILLLIFLKTKPGMNKNKVLKSSVLPLALCLTTMTFSPTFVV